MINWDTLVLRPAMATFARPIVVTPIKSQPSVAPYTARGVWSSVPIDVAVEGGIMSSQKQSLGLRISEFVSLPVPGDKIEIPAAGAYPRVGVCLIEDGDDDGQGGTVFSVKVIAP